MNRQETAAILVYILSDHESAPSESKIQVWHDQIRHLDPNFAMEAAKVLMREPSYGIPRVADFLAVVDSMSKTPAEKQTAAEAWQMVIEAAEKFGVNQGSRATLALGAYPRVIAAARQVGWKRICLADSKELPFVERKFVECFNSISERESEERKIEGRIGEGRLRSLINDTAQTMTLPGGSDATSKN